MASTGSNCEAEMAGRIPDNKPTTIDSPKPITTFKKLKTNSNFNTFVSSIVKNQTISKPIIPPITQRIIASNKN